MKPREKTTRYGVANLATTELLQLIVGSGHRGAGVVDIAKNVAKLLENKADLSLERLLRVDGVSKVAAMRIAGALELGRRIYAVTTTPMIKTSADSIRYFDQIISAKKEHVMAIYLNSNLEILGKEVVAIGGINQVFITPRELIASCMEYGAGSMIVAHNHPSGSLTASGSDIAFTKRLHDACQLIGIKLLDHLIVTPDGGWRCIEVERVGD